MKIRFGKLDAVLGSKATLGEWTFLACVGEAEGTTFEKAHRLSACVDKAHAPRALRTVLEQGVDAAWVRARLPRVFACAVGDPEVEKTLFWETIVAVRGDDAVMFACADYYGRTGLSFASALDEETKTAIARAFWDLLLSKPDELDDYALRTLHLGAGVWMNYACEDGEVSVTEEAE